MILIGAELLANTIAEAGIQHVFGVPGVYMLPLFYAIDQTKKTKVVLTRNEQGAAYMSDAYARKGRVGCCLATSGPGATHLLTGIAISYTDSIPVIAVTGQAALSEFGKYAIQEATGFGRTPDIMKMFQATTKWSIRVTCAETLRDVFLKAMHIATSGRPGPVHIDIPADVLKQTINPDMMQHYQIERTVLENVNSVNLKLPIAKVIQCIKEATCPLILFGGGNTPQTGTLVEAFSSTTGMQVVATYMGKGRISNKFPNYLGTVGSLGISAANVFFHVHSDLIIALGVSFSYLTTSGWPMTLSQKQLININIDQQELFRNYEPFLAIHADTMEFMSQLMDGMEDNKLKKTFFKKTTKMNECLGLIKPRKDPKIRPQYVMSVVNSVLAPNITVIADVGQNAYWAGRFIETYGDNNFIINGGMGAMGYGVAGAIGTALASSSNDWIICICGDGGFLMNGMELSIAAEMQLPIIWLLFNNKSLGTQKTWLRRNGMKEVACDLPAIEYASLAIALGVKAMSVCYEEELLPVLSQALQHKEPSLIEVRVDSTEIPSFFNLEMALKI